MKIPNRARMDAEGRFKPGPETKVVSTRAEAEALGLDFLVADGVLGQAECEQLVRTFRELQEPVFGASNEASFWDERGLWYADVLKHRPEAAAIMVAAMGRCLVEMKRFWKGFEGGTLYLTAQDVLLKLKAGTLISMTGGFHHEHGVVRVEKRTAHHSAILHDLRQGTR